MGTKVTTLNEDGRYENVLYRGGKVNEGACTATYGSRLIADIIMRSADKGDIEPLLAFASM
jgi:hypothetical protein